MDKNSKWTICIVCAFVAIAVLLMYFNSTNNTTVESFTAGGSFQQLMANHDNDQDSYLLAPQSWQHSGSDSTGCGAGDYYLKSEQSEHYSRFPRQEFY